MDCRSTQLSPNELESAFAEFNSASTVVIGQYKSLEKHVSALTGELKRANDARQKELQEKKRLAHRLASILAALPAGVLVFSEEGQLINWNQKAEQLLGIELKNKTWQEIASQNLAKGVLKTGDFVLNNQRKVSLSVQSLPNNGRIVLLSDVTESRNLQESWQHKERLSEIGEMMGKLAHQIRTPLSSAFLYLSQLRKKICLNKQQSTVDKLHACLDSVIHTLDDLLLYIKGQNPVMEDCEISALLKLVKVAFEGVQTCSELTIEHADQAGPKNIYINQHAVKGALLNLLMNSQEAGASDIKLSVESKQNGIAIEVIDNGAGIASGHQDEIFNAFHTSRANGTGLGLAIVKNVMELHGGTVQFDTNYRSGARFILWLPDNSEQGFLRSTRVDNTIDTIS